MNGIRALTEGFGPLVFGFLMYMFQNTRAPGLPYLLAGASSLAALYHASKLPTEAELWEYEKVVLRSEVGAWGCVAGLVLVLYHASKLPTEAELWEYEKVVLRSEVRGVVCLRMGVCSSQQSKLLLLHVSFQA